jgi:deoxyadenosine/deoxycytidine kinase/predicted NAD-dependent protein-ADP-ribosyltransferase YbiA (DUF1768 family)
MRLRGKGSNETSQRDRHPAETPPRSRPRQLVCLESNIGAGKSTLLRSLKTRLAAYDNLRFVDEPVDEWTSLGLLQAMYSREISAGTFQLTALSAIATALLAALQDPTVEVVISERSIWSNRAVFALQSLSGHDLTAYDYTFDNLSTVLAAYSFDVTFLYLSVPAATARRRIATRGRKCETDIDGVYLQDLEAAHDSMFAQLRSKTRTQDLPGAMRSAIINAMLEKNEVVDAALVHIMPLINRRLPRQPRDMAGIPQSREGAPGLGLPPPQARTLCRAAPLLRRKIRRRARRKPITAAVDKGIRWHRHQRQQSRTDHTKAKTGNHRPRQVRPAAHADPKNEANETLPMQDHHPDTSHVLSQPHSITTHTPQRRPDKWARMLAEFDAGLQQIRTAPPPEQRDLKPRHGDLALIDGLRSHAILNGTLALVGTHHWDLGRSDIFPLQGSPVRIKPECLILVARSAAQYPEDGLPLGGQGIEVDRRSLFSYSAMHVRNIHLVPTIDIHAEVANVCRDLNVTLEDRTDRLERLQQQRNSSCSALVTIFLEASRDAITSNALILFRRTPQTTAALIAYCHITMPTTNCLTPWDVWACYLDDFNALQSGHALTGQEVRLSIMSLITKDTRCAICLEVISGHLVDTRLPCGHSFHTRCISQMIASSVNHNTCPICRKSYTPNTDPIPLLVIDSRPATPSTTGNWAQAHPGARINQMTMDSGACGEHTIEYYEAFFGSQARPLTTPPLHDAPLADILDAAEARLGMAVVLYESDDPVLAAHCDVHTIVSVHDTAADSLRVDRPTKAIVILRRTVGDTASTVTAGGLTRKHIDIFTTGNGEPLTVDLDLVRVMADLMGSNYLRLTRQQCIECYDAVHGGFSARVFTRGGGLFSDVEDLINAVKEGQVHLQTRVILGHRDGLVTVQEALRQVATCAPSLTVMTADMDDACTLAIAYDHLIHTHGADAFNRHLYILDATDGEESMTLQRILAQADTPEVEGRHTDAPPLATQTRSATGDQDSRALAATLMPPPPPPPQQQPPPSATGGQELSTIVASRLPSPHGVHQSNVRTSAANANDLPPGWVVGVDRNGNTCYTHLDDPTTSRLTEPTAMDDRSTPSHYLVIREYRNSPLSDRWMGNMTGATHMDESMGRMVGGSEIGLQARKAIAHGKYELARSIVSQTSNWEARKMTQGQHGFEINPAAWDPVKEHAMSCAAFYKFRAGSALGLQLKNTTKPIVEVNSHDLASNGRGGIWSVGLTHDEFVASIARRSFPSWPGANLLGKALQKVRSFLQGNMEAFNAYDIFEGGCWRGPFKPEDLGEAWAAHVRAGGTSIRPSYDLGLWLNNEQSAE